MMRRATGDNEGLGGWVRSTSAGGTGLFGGVVPGGKDGRPHRGKHDHDRYFAFDVMPSGAVTPMLIAHMF